MGILNVQMSVFPNAPVPSWPVPGRTCPSSKCACLTRALYNIYNIKRPRDRIGRNELIVDCGLGHNGMIPNAGFNPSPYPPFGGGGGNGPGVRAFYHPPPPVFYFYPSPPVSPTAPPHIYQPPAHLVSMDFRMNRDELHGERVKIREIC